MAKTIQVFVRNNEVITGHFTTVEFSTPGHACTAKPITAPVLEPFLPETHKQAIEIAEKVAKTNRMHIKVYNLSSRKGKLKALFKGVREAPAVIIEKQKLTGEITEKKLLHLLEKTGCLH